MIHAWSSYEKYAWGNDELQGCLLFSYMGNDKRAWFLDNSYIGLTFVLSFINTLATSAATVTSAAGNSNALSKLQLTAMQHTATSVLGSSTSTLSSSRDFNVVEELVVGDCIYES
ncbi:hypothetical protein REPUB_Repub08aG0090500 [Reevesia pubescens]